MRSTIWALMAESTAKDTTIWARMVVPLGSVLVAHFGGEHVHQQPVVPLAGWPALVLAHQPDTLEADPLIGLDRARVVSGRVDRQAMVASLVDQKLGEGLDRVWSVAFALPG